MYDHIAQHRLRDKLDYELWLLNFIATSGETFEGGADISRFTFTNRRADALVSVGVTEVIGGGAALQVMAAMSPLTFTAAYKIVDMIFEWILEENARKVPWKFVDKIKAISSLGLVYPPLFQRYPWIRDYLFALYAKLLKFRNEIVHSNRFSLTGDELKVHAVEDGQSYTLAVRKDELGAFVRTVVAVGNVLVGVLSFGSQAEQLLKYHLDRIQKLHGLAEFGQQRPLLVDVVLRVPSEGGTFLADLGFVREELKRTYPGASVLFNLELLGLVDDRPTIKWRFPVDSVPQTDLLELNEDSYAGYRISLEQEAQS